MIQETHSKKSFLTASEAAKILNVSIATLKKFIALGKIKSFKTPGGHHRISRKDLMKGIYNP